MVESKADGKKKMDSPFMDVPRTGLSNLPVSQLAKNTKKNTSVSMRSMKGVSNIRVRVSKSRVREE